MPTTGTAYSLTQIAADPIARNNELGYYTNFTNLLDLAAIAVPSGFTARGFPTGVTLIGPAWCDMALAGVAGVCNSLPPRRSARPAFRKHREPPRQASPAAFPAVDLAVFGSHLSGEPLNRDLLPLGARFRCGCKTAPVYRMIVLPGTPARPGLIQVGAGGAAIEGEVWSLPSAAVGVFLSSIAPPLGIGTVLLEGGLPCFGFICEGEAASAGAKDISSYGSWRTYREPVRRQFGCPPGEDVPALI